MYLKIMEQYSQYLTGVKSKNMMINRCSHSWEEQAFAEDVYVPLGGLVWPPRSYSCSFCGREFRSAQALGGHMNVHRRERAKLKQSSDHPNITTAAPQQSEVISQLTYSLDHKYPSNFSMSSSRVPPAPGLGQETFCSTVSDTKSSVSDDIGSVETDLLVGLALDFPGDGENSVVYFKKPKTTNAGMPGIMSSMEEIDLELRL